MIVHQIASTVAHRVIYLEDIGELAVGIHGGANYVYSNVERDTFLNLVMAESFGEAYYRLIRGKHNSRRIDEG